MTFSPFRIVTFLFAFSLNVLIASPVQADQNDDEMLAARSAYDNKNVPAMNEALRRLRENNALLLPYAEYWHMLLILEDADEPTIQAFIQQYARMPFADRIRGEWLKRLAKQEKWTNFIEQYTLYQQNDPVVQCYAAEAKIHLYGIEAMQEAKQLWMQAKDQPSNCDGVFDKMQLAKVLSEDDILKRFRMALALNKVSLAKGIAGRMRGNTAHVIKGVDLAYSNPARVLEKKVIGMQGDFAKELYLYALDRISRNDSAQALSLFKRVQSNLNAEQQAYFYGRLALSAAKRQEPEALGWFEMATEQQVLDDEQWEWFARSALRRMQWDQLLNIVQRMPPLLKEHPTWRYWQARAYKAKENLSEANHLFAQLSTERHYYGWLAKEELDTSLESQPEYYQPNEDEIRAFSQRLPVQRALALQRLDFNWEAKMEWALATDGLNDKELITAAAFAAEQGWYDLAVITADKTTQTHNFALRYPTPYRDVMKPAAALQGIDEAWAYGIIRQESRFMHQAKSRVGASGLMQVMPATAKWIAKKIGWTDYHHGMIHELDANISLGTYYLKYTLDQFNGQEVMATAAYNAGPSRAKRWADNDLSIEGAIYAETIPFNETRHYVKRVMENAHLYAAQLGLPVQPLKQRLGIILPRNADTALSDTN